MLKSGKKPFMQSAKYKGRASVARAIELLEDLNTIEESYPRLQYVVQTVLIPAMEAAEREEASEN